MAEEEGLATARRRRLSRRFCLRQPALGANPRLAGYRRASPGVRSGRHSPVTEQRVAEEEGFEPSVPFSTAVFKTAALNHSATPPGKSV